MATMVELGASQEMILLDMRGLRLMNKVILLIILLFCTFSIQACNTKEENKMKMSDVNKVNSEKEKIQKEFTAFISKDGRKLMQIINNLNSKDGYFYMSIENGQISVDTEKGKEFEETSDNIKLLSKIMSENNLDQIVQEELNKDIILFRTINKDNTYAMHRLIYHKGELNPQTQQDYRKIADDFYYSYSVGE